jgi:hypothetical protein
MEDEMRRLVFKLLILLCIGAWSIRVHAEPNLAQATLNALYQNVIPARDPADLGKRLLNLPQSPTPPTHVPDRQVGDQEDFRVEDADTLHLNTVRATLLYSTAHVYMWFQNGADPDLTRVKNTADTFENQIYPTVHKYFGSEASPGIDGDVHIYILHAHGVGSKLAGYFAASSEYPRALEPSSNEHEMFIVNLDTLGGALDTQVYYATLSHEFQHMVHFTTSPNGDAWLNEGLSELSAALCGYLDFGFSASFLSLPATQLNAWPGDDSSTLPHYGASYLFASYFNQRFGPDALHDLEHDSTNSLETVRRILNDRQMKDPVSGAPITLETLFGDWVAANLIDTPAAGDGRFAYQHPQTQMPMPKTNPILPTATPQPATTNQWGTVYLDVATPGQYTMTFTPTATVKLVTPNPHSGSWMWWSGRADLGDTRLTHPFDLTQVSSAHLTFWTWYAIETGWDYAYVEVSKDGRTWTPLSAQDSAPAGGHGNKYGPGFTGYSGGTARTNASWRPETVDLSAYAGQNILVRFEYITDEEGSEEGMLIDDISIPELGYQSDAESGADGWIAEGWTRISNQLPAAFLVQKVTFYAAPDRAPVVTPLLLDTNSSTTPSQWDFSVGDGVSHVVFSVSGLTEFTTQGSNFSYQLTQK